MGQNIAAKEATFLVLGALCSPEDILSVQDVFSLGHSSFFGKLRQKGQIESTSTSGHFGL